MPLKLIKIAVDWQNEQEHKVDLFRHNLNCIRGSETESLIWMCGTHFLITTFSL